MKIIEIVFSPTGGTMKAADMVAKALGEKTELIDLCDPELKAQSIGKDELAVIAVPSFGGRAPALAIERIGMIKAEGSRCALIAVYGNREQEDTLLELSDAAEKCGFKVIAAAEAIAEHSIARKYTAGRPDAADEEKLSEFGKSFLKKAESGDDSKPAVPGNHPYKARGNGGPYPSASVSCSSCGICAEKCPAGAIDKADPQKTDKEKCISCMRCISLCPSSSRALPKPVTMAVTLALKPMCSERKECRFYLQDE